MTELLSDTTTPSDAELISSVRGGDVAAYGELFARHHEAANRLARQLVRGPDADDLVSEAFAKVLSVLQGGGGPDVAFRAYLLTAVRRLHVDKMRAGAKVQTSDDMSAFDPGVPFHDTAVASFETGAAAKAFATLPERWQLVLWHLEVEGQKPADIAPLLGMSPNSVSALAYRAREGLRQAFLTMHLADISDTDCRWVNEHLGAFVRNGLSNRDGTKVQTHLDQCRRCTAMYLELTEVNSNLAAIIAPLLLGAAATGYIASGGAAAGGLGLVATLVDRVRDVVTANAGAATAAGVAASVAAVATAGVMIVPKAPDSVVRADDPARIAAPSTPGAPGVATAPGERREASPTDDMTPVETPTTPTTVPVAAPSTPTPSELPTPEPSVLPSPESTPGIAPGDVVFAGPVSFDGQSVSFTVDGEPLPPTILLLLASKPDGVAFGGDGQSCQKVSGTEAVCTTATLTRSATFERVATTQGTFFSDTLPLAVTADQPETEVRLTVTVPGGDVNVGAPGRTSTFQVKGRDAAVPSPTPTGTPDPQPTAPVDPVDPTPTDPPREPTPTTPTEAEFALAVTATRVEPLDGTYSVSGTVTAPADLDEVTLTVRGSARIDSTGSSQCAVEKEDTSTGVTTLTCWPSEAGSSDFTFTITRNPSRGPVVVSMDLEVPAGWTDNPVGGTSQDVTLAPLASALAFDAAPVAVGKGAAYSVTMSVTGIGDDAEYLTFGLPDSQQAFALDSPPSDGCAVVDARTMTCAVPVGARELVVWFDAKLPSGNPSVLWVQVKDAPESSRVTSPEIRFGA